MKFTICVQLYERRFQLTNLKKKVKRLQSGVIQ